MLLPVSLFLPIWLLSVRPLKELPWVGTPGGPSVLVIPPPLHVICAVCNYEIIFFSPPLSLSAQAQGLETSLASSRDLAGTS